MEPAPAPRVKVVWTYEDYRTLPDDGRRYEVIDGELFVTPSPSTTHQRRRASSCPISWSS